MKKSAIKQNARVKKQLIDYNNLIKIRVYLQKLNSTVQRWPHPYISRLLIASLPPEDDTLSQIRANLLNLSKSLFPKVLKIGSIAFHPDSFADFDVLAKRRPAILERLDYLNDISTFSVNSSFKVVDNSISSQVKFFHDNPDKFVKKARVLNLPSNVIGYELCAQKLGPEESKRLHVSQLYNDQVRRADAQVFYVKLLNYLLQNDQSCEVDLKNEESLIRNNQQGRPGNTPDKLRLSLNKTSKGRKVRYTVIEKLQNFVASAR